MDVDGPYLMKQWYESVSRTRNVLTSWSLATLLHSPYQHPKFAANSMQLFFWIVDEQKLNIMWIDSMHEKKDMQKAW